LFVNANNFLFSEARKVWNEMIDKRSALIAQCTDCNDIAEAVKAARKFNLIVSVRGVVIIWPAMLLATAD
jgi:hypothetical protein